MNRRLLVAMHLPFVLAVLVTAVPRGDISPSGVALTVLVAVGLGGLQLRHSLAAADGVRPQGWTLTMAAMLALAYLPLYWYGWDWLPAQWFVIASLWMLLRGWGVVLGFAPLVGSACVLVVSYTNDGASTAAILSALGYFIALLLMGGAALYAAARLVDVSEALREARGELAQLAVGRERLRISRDLHDLLGQRLSAVSLKGDLAFRLVDIDPRMARTEIVSLTDVARRTLRDMRAVTRDDHTVSLAGEVEAATALLDAAGIETRVSLDVPPIDSGAEDVLAWAIREGSTNALRHSDARICSIRVARHGTAVLLEMTNDGAHPPVIEGSGLAGLRQRAEALAGGFSADCSDDGIFRVSIEIPARVR